VDLSLDESWIAVLLEIAWVLAVEAVEVVSGLVFVPVSDLHEKREELREEKVEEEPYLESLPGIGDAWWHCYQRHLFPVVYVAVV